MKLLGKFRPGYDGAGWHRHFPRGIDGNRKFANCEYIFDRNERHYDWLVVWDDLPSVSGERDTLWEEDLACSQANTMLVTTEPSTIKVYGSKFLRQFSHILTSQEPWAVGNHPGARCEQTSYVWFYSKNDTRGSYDAIRSQPIPVKTAEISAVCSTKQQRHTLHRKRYDFVMALKDRIPEMELYGRGIRFIEDKADALDQYKYHIAIENFYGPHHWTEKLADPFLGACMPVYYGCPNAELYFPEESFLRIDINDLEESFETIRKAITDKWYDKHLTAILESRRRIIEEYAPIPNITRLINMLHHEAAPSPNADLRILSRHSIRRKSIVNTIDYFSEKLRVSLKHRFNTSIS